VDYDIRVEILRQVRGGDVVVELVQVRIGPLDHRYPGDFILLCIWPKSRQIEFRNRIGRYGRFPWPADWSPDPDYTHPDHEAALVALATRLAVAEWQRRQEGGQ
jgi:hypothetical protein